MQSYSRACDRWAVVQPAFSETGYVNGRTIVILPDVRTNTSPIYTQSTKTVRHTTKYQYLTYPSFNIYLVVRKIMRQITDCMYAPNLRLGLRTQLGQWECGWLIAGPARHRTARRCTQAGFAELRVWVHRRDGTRWNAAPYRTERRHRRIRFVQPVVQPFALDTARCSAVTWYVRRCGAPHSHRWVAVCLSTARH